MLLVYLFVYFARVNFRPFSLPRRQGLAAAYDCGTSWTFLLSCLCTHIIAHDSSSYQNDTDTEISKLFNLMESNNAS